LNAFCIQVRNSGGAKVEPAWARAPAVKTCAPAVGWLLNGESRDSSSQLTAKKSYLTIGTNFSILTCLPGTKLLTSDGYI